MQFCKILFYVFGINFVFVFGLLFLNIVIDCIFYDVDVVNIIIYCFKYVYLF